MSMLKKCLFHELDKSILSCVGIFISEVCKTKLSFYELFHDWNKTFTYLFVCQH